jgi:hypothetical protein
MRQKGICFFISFSGILLLVTAAAKLISGVGTAKLLRRLDPVFFVSFREILYVAAVMEITVAAFCLFGRNRILRAGLIAMLATNLLFYRFGLYWQGYSDICPCLGNITDALRIPPQTADTVMKIILAYLLIGSYASLFWLWRQGKRATSSASER